MSAAAAPGLEGGCLCGRIRYRATPDKREGYYCHCRMCQLAFGNTRVPFLNLRQDQVEWLAEKPKHYASSKFAVRGFCGNCGTPLSFAYDGSKNMDISVGSLDDPSSITPVSHFAVETRVENWHCDDGLPGTRLDEHVKLMERWKAAYGDDVEPGRDATRD